MEKQNKAKILHIVIIVLGIIFVGFTIFHENIWFDEVYSVGMARHSFIDIWKIGGNDVHPVLYYWLLRIVDLITGSSIIAYRIFSALGVVILGILGYTHIRKDFGEKTGIIFSFLSYFLPAMPDFANQIRMYSWAILSVTILAIYGYRIVKQSSMKNWIIFELASIFSIFIHYYGLMAAGIINICLLIYLIKNKKKQDIITIVIGGIIQAILYIPWLIYFAKQLNNISHGFWIGFDFPNTLIELLSFQFIGNIKNYYLGFIISILVYIFAGICLFKAKKQNEDLLPVKLSIGIYFTVIIAAIIMTIILGTSIVYYRYLFVITGLYIFTLSFALSKEKNNYIIVAICAVILILGIMSTYIQFKDNYSQRNEKPIQYMKENIQKDDILVYNFAGSGFVMTAFFDNKQIFYNPENWGVEEAYKAFGENFKVSVDETFLDECEGRIWIIDNKNKDVYNKLFNNEKYTLVSDEFFETDYENYEYDIILVEK